MTGQSPLAPEQAPIRRILADLFPGRERVLLLGVLCVTVVSAVFETIAVAAILPFMALVLDPALLERYPSLLDVLTRAGITSTRQILMLAGAATVAVVALGNAAGAFNTFVQSRFGARTETRLSADLYAGYVSQPYSFHVQRDAPSLLKVLSADVSAVMHGVLIPGTLAVSRLVMAAGVLSVLILRDPLVALLVALVLILSYVVIFRAVRNSQARSGSAANVANELRARISQEGLGGIKELRVLGREAATVRGFAAAVEEAALARAGNNVVAQVPRYALETIAFGGILLATLALVNRSSGAASDAIPVLALYAFAGYRLMPALQQMFHSTVNLRFYLPALRTLHADYIHVAGASPATPEAPASDLQMRESLQLQDVTFSYEGADKPALRDINLNILPHQSIGLVGRTGAGKTTLADIILALHQPESGVVAVDGVPLTGHAVRQWQRRVGYVSQSVFLGNSSIAQNIAFGLPPDEIDMELVVHAARDAQAEEFILRLPAGYDTMVGERGVRLSGGQRQRIGIARALYHEPDVLVFDEATSALDGLTEDAVMDAVRTLRGTRTIILIAHRLRTVEACDRIVVLEDGRIVDEGQYDELMLSSPSFMALVGRTAPVRPAAAEQRI
jgi:ATP-binding cassette, subfamily B, bacterial PglK